jgi:hypothetical protein
MKSESAGGEKLKQASGMDLIERLSNSRVRETIHELFVEGDQSNAKGC